MHGGYSLKVVVSHIVVETLVPPLGQCVKSKLGLSLLQNVETHVVQVIVSEVDFVFEIVPQVDDDPASDGDLLPKLSLKVIQVLLLLVLLVLVLVVAGLHHFIHSLLELGSFDHFLVVEVLIQRLEGMRYS